MEIKTKYNVDDTLFIVEDGGLETIKIVGISIKVGYKGNIIKTEYEITNGSTSWWVDVNKLDKWCSTKEEIVQQIKDKAECMLRIVEKHFANE